ncbi:MAG TPA: tRNA (adenosine(37)-N6)-threonylcarbamoyltransferase complex dimerization subunit type 1 TsaB [Verrucomicrobiae bacterium]|nr:tRNA (adenosine(37)-N6)-threonylcarbamoyltransferase complex dimerization subunit type 1 TsaB [Verrucomicrobiae bacterium]
MILAIKTDTPTCEIQLVPENGQPHMYTWEAGRELAKGLLAFIEAKLTEAGTDWDSVSGIIVFKGPGSFTGLRIGITVANTIAYASDIPIVGTGGDTWATDGLKRLQNSENDKLVLPEYGAEPHITKAKK